MATINNIPFLNYGLHLISSKGVANLPEAKEQFYNVFGKAGYQVTKRRAETLEIHAFIIANDLADFITKSQELYTLFSSAGLKVISIGNGDLNTFAKDGFKITNVHILGKVYAKFHIKLSIV